MKNTLEKFDFSKIEEKMKYYEKSVKEDRGKISENKKFLRELEEKDEFVFHGSYQKLEILEPRQAKNMNRETGEMENDGPPSVSATPYIDIAIFRSIVNSFNSPKNHCSSFRTFIDEETREIMLKFGLSDEDIRQIKESKEKIRGYIHVLLKKFFEKKNDFDYRFQQSIKPTEIIEVKFEDLPIKI